MKLPSDYIDALKDPSNQSLNFQAVTSHTNKHENETEAILANEPDVINLIYEFQKKLFESSGVREDLFNKLLDAYIDAFSNKTDKQNRLKKPFFWIILVILILITIAPIATSITLAVVGGLSDIQYISVIVACFVELLTAFIVLPKIIAKYLFNLKEDKHFIKIVKTMQKYTLQQLPINDLKNLNRNI